MPIIHLKETVKSVPRKVAMIKTAKLAKAIGRSVSLFILEGQGEPLLSDLTLVAVEPVPGNSCFHLLFCSPSITSENISQITRTKRILEKYKPMIRSQIAQRINRKKVPDLVFQVVPRSNGQ